ncbi:MAG: hypothetical protein RMI83_04515 [Desulfurococcaceae archaeon]|nr:hypothetical protein [Sulfolobales archaeon]MDW8170346.1 hypothetical protein [Desulfurococcaceae archaeon]
MKIAILGVNPAARVFLNALASDGVDFEELTYAITPSISSRASYLNEEFLEDVVKESDLVINSLPKDFSRRALLISKKLCKNFISTVQITEDLGELSSNECSSIFIPCLNIAPGLSSIIAGRILSLMEELFELNIYFGGLSKISKETECTAILSSIEEFLSECSTKAKALINGVLVELDPLSSVSSIEVPRIGSLWAVRVDRLGTLIQSVGNVARNASISAFRLICYNAVEYLRKLRALLLAEPSSSELLPRGELEAESEKFIGIDHEFLLYVKSRGVIEGAIKGVEYFIKATYDYSNKISASHSLEGLTLYAVVRALLIDNLWNARGLILPELIGMNEGAFTYILAKLVEKGIEVRVL